MAVAEACPPTRHAPAHNASKLPTRGAAKALLDGLLMEEPSTARERLARYGPQVLDDADLVALLLSTGSHRDSVQTLSAKLLAQYGGLGGLSRATCADLSRLAGVGCAKASRLIAACELGRRAEEAGAECGSRIQSSADVFSFASRLRTAEVEHFVAFGLDAKHRLLGEFLVGLGGIAACPVTPADAFRGLVRNAAKAVIFAHNHPSGDPEPSPEDVDLTGTLYESGRLLGIEVLDHVIIADQSYFSFLDHGMLPPALPAENRRGTGES